MVRYVYFKSTRIYLKVLLPKSLLRMPPARPLSAALPHPQGAYRFAVHRIFIFLTARLR
jgi:hypothetical protein